MKTTACKPLPLRIARDSTTFRAEATEKPSATLPTDRVEHHYVPDTLSE